MLITNLFQIKGPVKSTGRLTTLFLICMAAVSEKKLTEWNVYIYLLDGETNAKNLILNKIIIILYSILLHCFNYLCDVYFPIRILNIKCLTSL